MYYCVSVCLFVLHIFDALANYQGCCGKKMVFQQVTVISCLKFMCEVRRTRLLTGKDKHVTSFNAYVVSLSGRAAFSYFFFSVSFLPCFYFLSITALCSVLSPAYHGDLIARGPREDFREVLEKGG